MLAWATATSVDVVDIAPVVVSACIRSTCVASTSTAAPARRNGPPTRTPTHRDKVDLSAGLLRYITRFRGWDVPEAWYYLAKAYGLQGRKDEERECLVVALALSERRCIRDVGRAVGWCL